MLPPSRPLAGRLGSDAERARFWELVRDEGGILVRAGAGSCGRVVYVRAEQRGGERVFTVSGPTRAGEVLLALAQVREWARTQMVLVNDAYLPGSAVAGVTPGELLSKARGAAERAMRYLAGDPGADLDAAGQRAALMALLGGPPVAGLGLRRRALMLLEAADDQVLGELLGDGGVLLGVLAARIPVGDSLRGVLDGFIGARFAGGWAALNAGTVKPAGQPPLAFAPGLLDGRLEGVSLDGALTAQETSLVTGVLAHADPERMIRQLGRLSAVQRARAGRWLLAARVAIHPRAAEAGLHTAWAVSVLEHALDAAYHDAAAWVPDIPALSLRTLIPTPQQAPILRAALGATAQAFSARWGEAAAEMMFSWSGVRGAVPALIPELAMPRPQGAPTPSGRVFLASGAPGMTDDGGDKVAAAHSFPPVAGATVVHVHAAGGGTEFVVDDQVLTAAEFGGRVVALGLPAGQLVIIVACRALAAAPVLAARLGAPVVAASADAYTLPGGTVVAAQTRYTGDGAAIPVLGSGEWMLVRAGQDVDQHRVQLGPDLLAAIDTGVLDQHLPVPLSVGQAMSPPPAWPVRWSSRGSTGHEHRPDQAGPSVPGTAEPVVTRSGFYLPGGPAAGGARAEDELAAEWFPAVTGAVVWHVHLDRATGGVLAGDRVLTPEQFYGDMVSARQPPGTLLVIVGCGAAAVAPGAGEPRRRRCWPGLAAARCLRPTWAWTTPQGHVLAAPETPMDYRAGRTTRGGPSGCSSSLAGRRVPRSARSCWPSWVTAPSRSTCPVTRSSWTSLVTRSSRTTAVIRPSQNLSIRGRPGRSSGHRRSCRSRCRRQRSRRCSRQRSRRCSRRCIRRGPRRRRRGGRASPPIPRVVPPHSVVEGQASVSAGESGPSGPAFSAPWYPGTTECTRSVTQRS